MTITYRQATLEDATTLYSRLRPADKRDITLSAGPDVLGTLQKSIAMSEVCRVAEDDKGLLCIFGVSRPPIAEPMGIVWMLGTDRLKHYSRELVTEAKPWIDSMLTRYGLLTNCVNQKNVRAIEWLKRLGFTIGPVHPEFGPAKKPFHQFFMKANTNV